MVIRSLHIYYIVCRVPRFGLRFGTAVYVWGEAVRKPQIVIPESYNLKV